MSKNIVKEMVQVMHNSQLKRKSITKIKAIFSEKIDYIIFALGIKVQQSIIRHNSSEATEIYTPLPKDSSK